MSIYILYCRTLAPNHQTDQSIIHTVCQSISNVLLFRISCFTYNLGISYAFVFLFS